MSVLFFVFIILIFLNLPLHFLSVNHTKLEDIFGKKKGLTIGKLLGMISGWGFFIYLFGLWFSPQPRFYIPFILNYRIFIPFTNLIITELNIILSIPFILLSIWLGIEGVKATTLKVSETHYTDKIVKDDIYSIIRHPQYLGAILAHIGFSILLSASYSLLSTILIIFYNYLVSWKEEKELIKEYGHDYLEYKKKVPMFIPNICKLMINN
ncbi:MAG: hypothetical protein GF317_24395 [Candidatus Lokiarchaeota archaeon]|nr:hypothetical protein [Candidatus Lokiarchaeota archaeon]MBD3202514.1 hypothetical protein [Candidatus Lokiarchaeota archaeon]